MNPVEKVALGLGTVGVSFLGYVLFNVVGYLFYLWEPDPQRCVTALSVGLISLLLCCGLLVESV